MTPTISGTTVRAVPCLTSIGLIALLSGCQLDVTNPGPIQADALEGPKAVPGVVDGAWGRSVDGWAD